MVSVPWHLRQTLARLNYFILSDDGGKRWNSLGNGYATFNGNANSGTSLRATLLRRPARLFGLLASLLFASYAFVRILQYTIAFYTSGEFVKYHMEMTPPIGVSESPSKSIDVAAVGYSAVFLYLISAQHLKELLLSLSYLHKNVPSRPWPILLFHGPYMDPSPLRTEFLLRLYDTLGGGPTAQSFISRIEFVRIELALPKGMSSNKVTVDPVFIDDWPGLHLMQGFFATTVFDHPRLVDHNVTYYMRLDPDVFVYEKLCYDPFEIMHARNRKYGYGAAEMDPGWVTHDMWGTTDNFVSTRPEVRERIYANNWIWPDDVRIGRMNNEPYNTYDTSFELVRLDAFRTDNVREWFKQVTDDYNFIYKYRWGSGPIRFATVNMYLDVEKDTEEFCGVRYFHEGVRGRQCSCEAQKAGRTS